MPFVILLFATSLLLSAVAGYYSIVGLIAIFAATPISIAVMGASLEVTKLVTASWLYRNWKNSPKILKGYFSAAVVILMLITSLGIFGYLSKAHSEQGAITGEVAARVAILDEKIKMSKENIDANRKALKQLDEAVDQIMVRSTTEQGASNAVQIRRQQAKERTRLLQEIEAEQKIVAKLTEDRAPIAAEIRKIEAEVGPIKYIASFIYGETSTELLEKAVTWVIIIIVLVFDPMAVLLLIAANYSLQQLRGTIPKKVDMTTVEPVALDKDEIVNATKLYHRDQDSM